MRSSNPIPPDSAPNAGHIHGRTPAGALQRLLALGSTLLLLTCVGPSAPPAWQVAPMVATEAIDDDYHGVRIADPYRWLEDQDGAATAAFVRQQNARTQEFLASCPQRQTLRARLRQLFDYARTSPPEQHGPHWYAWHNPGLLDQSVLHRGPDPTTRLEVVLDPNQLSKDGTCAINGLSFSRDGRYLAYAVSDAGSDWRTWRIKDLQNLRDLTDVVAFSKFGTVAWHPDNRGFWYLRYPTPTSGTLHEASNQGARLCFHRLGEDQDQDTVALEDRANPRHSYGAEVSEDGRFLIVTTRRGTDPKYEIRYLRIDNDNATLQPLCTGFDATYRFLGSRPLGSMGEALLFLTDHGAPRRRVVAIQPERPAPAAWQQVVAETNDTLERAHVAGNDLLLTYLHQAHHRVLRHSLVDGSTTVVELPQIGSVSNFTGNSQSTLVTFGFSSITMPERVLGLDLRTGRVASLHEPVSPFRQQDFATRQVWFEGRDGTRLCMFLAHRHGLRLDGRNRTYLFGYGGFDISLIPRYRPEIMAWLEQGHVFAQATLRGGGEFGREWHEAGRRQHKQRVFDDFIAAAHYLLRNGITTRNRLAIGGRSNGGLLVGAVMTQQPDLCGAAIPEVGVLDMLRYHRFTIGHAWIPEYGSSEDPQMFTVLRAYSPLHNIVAGRRYPATLVMTGDHDDRVLPGHSYKFAATLQAAQPTNAHVTAPILLRVETRAGHGAGTPISMRIDEAADRWAFLLQTLAR